MQSASREGAEEAALESEDAIDHARVRAGSPVIFR
jgi:hypothetical protein